MIDSPAAVAAGITAPFPGFQQLWKSRATVAQALRPFPQYSTIDTAGGQGDHSGHSTYHAGLVKLEKRYASGITFQTSYVFSKLLTDADSAWPQLASGDAVKVIEADYGTVLRLPESATDPVDNIVVIETQRAN